GARSNAQISHLLERISSIVLLQLPLVALALLVGWFFLPSSWEPLHRPLALLLVGFLLSFPLRIPTAVLTGLQDLGFIAYAQLACWALGTLLSIVLVLAGMSLIALVLGYLTTQLTTSLCSLVRLRQRWPDAMPRGLSWPSSEHRRYLSSAGWAIVGQVALLF